MEVREKATAGDSTAADEMDDLQPITITERGIRPISARHDQLIEFHGDAVGLHLQSGNQSGEGGDAVKLPGFAVDDELHK